MNSFVKVLNSRDGTVIINKVQIAKVNYTYFKEGFGLNSVHIVMSQSQADVFLAYDKERDGRPGTDKSRMIEDIKLLTGVELSMKEFKESDTTLKKYKAE